MTNTVISEPMALRLEAERWALLEEKRKIEEKVEALDNKLRDYVYETGQTEFGNTKAYERTSPAKLIIDSEVSKDTLTAMLMESVPGIVKQSLDLTRLYDMAQTDKKVERQLKRLKVRVVKDSKIYFKHI